MKAAVLVFVSCMVLGLMEFLPREVEHKSDALQERSMQMDQDSLFKVEYFKDQYYSIKKEIQFEINPLEARNWIESKMESLSLEDKIGQLLIVDLDARALKNLRSPAEVIRKHKVGGFLVPRMKDPAILHGETRALQKLSDTPLFFAADYERGAGRYLNNFTELPSSMALGSTRNGNLAWMAGALTALESRTFGVNFILAPVVDVNNNPKNPIINIRSYAEQSNLVATLTRHYQEGLHEYGVLSTFKHFPGHGNTVTDTHYRMGTVESSLEELENVELFPYKELFGTGDAPDAVMTAHLWIKAINKYPRPATFSKTALRGILRDRLGFEGIVMTDDIGMGALRSKYNYHERIITCVMAGVDIILGSQDLNKTVSAIKQAVANGSIPLERIDESVRRILEAKTKIGLHIKTDLSRTSFEHILGQPRGEKVAEKIADAAATGLGSWADLLPFSTGKSFSLIQLSNVTKSTAVPAAMDEMLRLLKKDFAPSEHRVGEIISANRRKSIVESAKKLDGPIVLSLFLRIRGGNKGATLSESQITLVRDLLNLENELLLVTMGSPYVVDEFENADAFLVLYDQSIASVKAAAKAINGEISPGGKLPVSLDEFPYGSGS